MPTFTKLNFGTLTRITGVEICKISLSSFIRNSKWRLPFFITEKTWLLFYYPRFWPKMFNPFRDHSLIFLSIVRKQIIELKNSLSFLLSFPHLCLISFSPFSLPYLFFPLLCFVLPFSYNTLFCLSIFPDVPTW